jgi:hypothetical protein
MGAPIAYINQSPLAQEAIIAAVSLLADWANGRMSKPAPSSKSMKKSQTIARTKIRGSGAVPTTTVVSAPVSTSFRTRSNKPQFKSKGPNVVITHKEMLADFDTSDTFTTRALVVNAGNSACFPWLSTIAANYEEYIFHSLTFEHVPTQATTSPGRSGMYIEPDPTDPLPVTKQQAGQMSGAVTAAVWDTAIYNTPKNILKRLPSFMVSNDSGGAAPGASTSMTYDMGRLIEFSYADASPGTVEVWVSYTVELRVPSFANSVSAIPQAGFTYFGGAVAPAAVFGTQAYFDSNTYGSIIDWVDSATIIFSSAFNGILQITSNKAGSVSPVAYTPDTETGTTAVLTNGLDFSSTNAYVAQYTVSAATGQTINFVPTVAAAGSLTNFSLSLSPI